MRPPQTSERIYLNGIIHAVSISSPITSMLYAQYRDIISNDTNSYTVYRSGMYHVQSFGEILNVTTINTLPDVYLSYPDRLVVL